MADYDDYSKWVGLGAQLTGSLAGSTASQGDYDKQLELYKQLLAKYQGVPLPGQEQMAPDYYGPSALANVKEDPAALSGYTQADNAMGDLIAGGGMTLADKANQASIYQRLAQQNAHQQGNIKNDLASRGALNSGAALAMQLQSQQQGSQQAADAARDTAAGAQARAYQAIRDRASQAMGRSNQLYQRQADAARAADAIAQHNASARNQALQYNNGLSQTQYQNQLTPLRDQATAVKGLSDAYGDQGQRTNQMYSGMGTAVNQTLNNPKPTQGSAGDKLRSAWKEWAASDEGKAYSSGDDSKNPFRGGGS